MKKHPSLYVSPVAAVRPLCGEKVICQSGRLPDRLEEEDLFYEQ